MFEAARLHDEVVHTSALGGFLVGAALGVALIVGVALATATCGLGVALLAGVMAGVGGMALTSLGESIGKMMSSPAGKITTGSPNIYINGENAALAEESLALCEKHPNPPPMIAEGSGKVFYNGKGAARKGDKLTCGGTIDGGSSNVFVGAESVPYLPIDDEVPQWLRTTVDVLMSLAGGAASLVKMGLFASKSGLKALTPCALKFAAGFTAGELAGRFIVGPAIGRMAGALFGNPVDAVNGRKILLEEHETDFSLPGLMPLTWARFYASDLTHEGLLGRGWVLPWEQSLRQGDDELILCDNQGRELPLPALNPGERAYLTDEQLFVVRTEGGHYLLQTLDNTFLYFGDLAEDGTPAPLRRIENALGHFIALSYDQEQTLTDISTTGGTRVHLCYDPTGKRVTRVERVVDNQPVETLVQYHYDKNGQLAEVIDRSGSARAASPTKMA